MISMKFVPDCLINNIPALFETVFKTNCRPGAIGLDQLNLTQGK